MTGTNGSVSVVIVNYNAGPLLTQCIESLRMCTAVSSVVIVDNASSDDSLEPVMLMQNVDVVRNTINKGFAVACNMGLARTDSDYILFLNPDCVVDALAINQVRQALDSCPDAAMASGVLVDELGFEQRGSRRTIPTPWRSFVRAFGLHRFANRWPRLFSDFNLHEAPLPDQTIEVEALSGAFMLVKRAAIEQVGPWDEQYFLHCEDLDWCMRFRQHGWKLLFVPQAKIVHRQGACSKAVPVFVEWHKHRGMIRFYRKFFRYQYPGPLMWFVSVGVWSRFAAIVSLIYYKRFFTQATS